MMTQEDMKLIRLVKDRLENALIGVGAGEILPFRIVLMADTSKFGCQYESMSQYRSVGRILCNIDLIRKNMDKKSGMPEENLRHELFRKVAREYGHLLVENLHMQVNRMGSEFAAEVISHFGGIDHFLAEDFSLFITGDFFCDDQFWLDFLPKFTTNLCDGLIEHDATCVA